jgi:hypothetical protein
MVLSVYGLTTGSGRITVLSDGWILGKQEVSAAARRQQWHEFKELSYKSIDVVHSGLRALLASQCHR